MDLLDEMAKTANNILQANASSKIAAVSATVSKPEVAAVRRPPRPQPSSARRRDVFRLHQRYGRDAFRCDKPDSCSMRNVIRTTPLPPRFSGNGTAGGQ